MNLRQQLLARSARPKVAQLHSLATQHRNSDDKSATSTATPAQLSTPVTGEATATRSATPPQLTSCAGGDSVPPKVAPGGGSCAPVAPPADQFDTRVTCTACRFLSPGNYCRSHMRAGLTSRVLAPVFTELRQHCSGFEPSDAKQAEVDLDAKIEQFFDWNCHE
jgi:hypothetical protein